MSDQNPLDGVNFDHLASGGADEAAASQGTPPVGESSDAPAQDLPQHVPYERFNEVVRERTRVAGRVQELERQIAALTGVQQTRPPEPEDPRLMEVRQDLYRVLPSLKEVERLAKIAERLEQMAQTVPQMQDDQQAYWDGVADRTISDVWTQAQAKLGMEQMPEPLKGMIYREFSNYVTNNPQAARRYQLQDRALVSEFVDQLANHLAPARRQSAASVEQRRDRAARTPQGGTSSPVVGSAPPAKPKNEDDLLSSAFAGFQSFLAGGR